MLTDDFIANLTNARKKMMMWPWLAFLCLILWPATIRLSPFLFLLWPILIIALIVFVRKKDVERRTVHLDYPDELRSSSSFQHLSEAFQGVMSSRKVWWVVTSKNVKDRKRNAGATQHITRWRAGRMIGLPKYVSSNVKVPIIITSKTICFFSDAILVVHGRNYTRISYDQLEISSGTTRFIESGFYPKDAPVVDHTWQVVNKSGGRDRRMKSNRELPVLRYDTLDLASGGVINEELYISLPDAADAFVDACEEMQRAKIVHIDAMRERAA